MRDDLIPTDAGGKIHHLSEECAELISALSDVIKAVSKYKRFGAKATDPKTGIEYDNVKDICSALTQVSDEFNDYANAVRNLLEDILVSND